MKSSLVKRPDQAWLRAFLFTVFGAMVLLVSYFPLYYRHLGFSSTQIGYLYAIGPMISIFSNMFWSMASDRYGTIKKVLLVLLAGQMLLALCLAATSSFGMVLFIITCFYFFYYPIYPLADTMSISTAAKYGKNFTTIRVFGSLGYAFFAIVIGYILTSAGSSWAIWVAIGLALISLVIGFRLHDQSSGAPGKMNVSGILDILRSREMLWFFACVFLLAIGHRMNEAFLTISLQDLGADQGLIGWALLVSSISEIPMFFLLSLYGDRFRELPLLIIASLMYVLRFFLMGIVDTPVGMMAVQAMHSVTFGIFYVTSLRYLTRLVPSQFRATGMALFTIVWSSASGLLSGAFGGIIFEEAGRTAFYYTAMAFSLAAFAGLILKPLLVRSTDSVTADSPTEF
ncbi:MFS transporter [Paenibacillus sp. JX-17]|uniref:MFS transporter n=1 Tax=Paenibacillus lacisoli TaxID=3064525 RepID=A0ABT9C9T5_9BACL|nr:MFS transporter [Paenibacillus sp. JX-17]MDO7906021.1 MFS transporter [Paenibacillus sp. JX-17]